MPGIPSDLRRVHRSIVLRKIFSTAKGSRTQLAEETGLSTMAITRIIRELIEAGLIEEVSKKKRKSSPGRRQTELRICPSGAYVIGVVISAFGHQLAVFDASGNLVKHRHMSFKSISDADEVIETVSSTIISIIKDSGVNVDRIIGIGIAIAAIVKTTTGTVIEAPYLGWQEVELGRSIRESTGLPVTVENIADAINVAEQAKGETTGHEDIFLAHQSVTCGASYTHQGQLVRGANYSTGQIGHLPVGESSLVCSCGDTKCFNSHTSGWAVLARLGRIKSMKFETDNIESYARALTQLIEENPEIGTPGGDALYQAGYQFGRTMQNVTLIINPHSLVLAGKLSESPAYVNGCKSAWENPAAKLNYKPPRLIIGQVSAINAAGILALNSFFYSPQLNVEGLMQETLAMRKEKGR